MTACRYVIEHVYPVVIALLPDAMLDREAFAMLTAIGLQESGFQHRRQRPHGPARGFFQFELGGTEGVLEHVASRDHAARVLEALCYPAEFATARDVHLALEHHDVLACCFARLLLWTDPRPLPGPTQAPDGWLQYLSTWRPGKPRQSTWAGHFARAWSDEPWREVTS